MTQVLGQTSHFCSHRLLGLATSFLPGAIFGSRAPAPVVSVATEGNCDKTLICPRSSASTAQAGAGDRISVQRASRGPEARQPLEGTSHPSPPRVPRPEPLAMGALLSRSVAGHILKGRSQRSQPCPLDTGMWIPGKERAGVTA